MGSGQPRRNRELSREQRERVARILREHLDAIGEADATQRRIAQLVGLSQPTIPALLAAEGSLGVHALIAIRDFTGRSIDDLLGLPPLRAERSDLRASLLRALEALDEAPPSGERTHALTASPEPLPLALALPKPGDDKR